MVESAVALPLPVMRSCLTESTPIVVAVFDGVIGVIGVSIGIEAIEVGVAKMDGTGVLNVFVGVCAVIGFGGVRSDSSGCAVVADGRWSALDGVTMGTGE